MRIGKDGRIRVEVPVRFINDQLSPGLKRGGVLNIVRHDIEVICPYDHIPPYFEIDLTGLEIGRSIHISAVTLPKDAELTIKDRDFTIATIAGAVKQEEEAPTAAAAAAGRRRCCGARPRSGDKGAAAAKGGAAPAAAKGGAAAPAAKAAAPAAKKK